MRLWVRDGCPRTATGRVGTNVDSLGSGLRARSSVSFGRSPYWRKKGGEEAMGWWQ